MALTPCDTNSSSSSSSWNQNNNIDFSLLAEYIMERAFTLKSLTLSVNTSCRDNNQSHIVHFYNDILSSKPLLSRLEHLKTLFLNWDYQYQSFNASKASDFGTGTKRSTSPKLLSSELLSYLSTNNTLTRLGSFIPVSNQIVDSGVLSKSNIKLLSISLNESSFDYQDNNHHHNNNPLQFNNNLERLSIEFDIQLSTTATTTTTTTMESTSSSSSCCSPLEIILDPLIQSNWLHSLKNLTHLELQYPPPSILSEVATALLNSLQKIILIF
ncbi:hypothetical protein PPL_04162 [Heterostelium album PN500]|uniref:Uncharacterized protein n=1 Tax=Heterostelium pallidum (strain ATCC 26659 / Pp 5 / PN500) TaxID=670386 RepID=D3B671_HETP5|nr:hypothetical protein PPL_04162 [Heterostelium album PN500]EFA83369.1 hypothetical protein PPL_04162 [Heterostelium album PN500]|eukprot:XP_020435486.1 hypothetical protein PPL_04162 [Heterostelium album PN500]